jgi:hypothetical protein
MEQLKAISQNVMHSSVGITDGIYGRLVADDVHETIANLTEENDSKQENNKLLGELLRILKNESRTSYSEHHSI